MGWRFRRSIKIAPGIRWNISKSGTSWSFGPRGYKINVGPRGVRKTVSLPGTGIFYTEQVSASHRARSSSSYVPSQTALPSSPSHVVFVADPARFGLSGYVGRKIAIFFAAGCALASVALAISGRQDLAGLPFLAGAVGVVTAMSLPNAARRASRELHRRVWLFHVEAQNVATDEDPLGRLRQTQSELGLLDQEVAPDVQAVQKWLQEREAQAFSTQFASQFPSGKKDDMLALQARVPEGNPSHVVQWQRRTLAAALRVMELQQQVEASGGALPISPDVLGLAGRDVLHFSAAAFLDKHGPNDENGQVLLTDKRLIFKGTSVTSCAWRLVAATERADAVLSVQRHDRQTPWVFTFDSIADATCADYVLRRLISDPRPFTFVVPEELTKAVVAAPAPLLRSDLPQYRERQWADRARLISGLTIASLFLIPLPFVTKPSPVAPVRLAEAPQAAAPAVPPHQVKGADANAVLVVVSSEIAKDDAKLLAIARFERQARRSAEVMFWTNADAVPAKLPLSKVQLRSRIATFRVEGGRERLQRLPTPGRAERVRRGNAK
jgi:hypothetical protein